MERAGSHQREREIPVAVLRDRLYAGIATTALSLGGAFGVANAQQSSVMGAPASQAASATQQATVPMRNVRGTSEAFLRLLAADVSKDTVVLIVYGNDRVLYDQAKKAAIDATSQGYTVKGILVADGEPALEIYADAQSVATMKNPTGVNTDSFVASIRSDIRHAYTEIILPRRAERLAQMNDQPLISAR